MNIHIVSVPINQSNQCKSLGLIIDENLSWKARIHEISRKSIPVIGSLKRVSPFVTCLPQEHRITIFATRRKN